MLEDGIIELETDPTAIKSVVNEATLFESNSKDKLNTVSKFLNKNVKNESVVREPRQMRNNSVKLQKLENPKGQIQSNKLTRIYRLIECCCT